MKKIIVFLIAAPLLAGCTTSTQMAGTTAGATFGSILGSSIGGLTGGPRGSDIGTIVGMITGAAVGNVATAPRNRSARRTGDDIYDNGGAYYNDQYSSRYNGDAYTDDSYNAGRETTGTTADFSATQQPQTEEECPLTVENLRFVDDNRNQTINGGESCKVVFEMMNRSGQTVYNVVPYISETSGNKHLVISPSTRIESIAPGTGIRYTAIIKADTRLGNGTATFQIAIAHDEAQFTPVREFQLRTSKKS